MQPDTNIVVASTRMDNYGNQFIVGADGQEYKIGEKRSNLHALAQPGAALILKWGNYNNNDYVSDVRVSGAPTPPAPAAPPTPAPAGYAPLNKDIQIARAVALKAAVDNSPEGTRPQVNVTEAEFYLTFLCAGATAPAAPPPVDTPKASVSDLKALTDFVKSNDIQPADVKATSLLLTGKENARDLTKAEVSTLIDLLTEGLSPPDRTPEELPF